MAPKYKHDCKQCHFLGRAAQHDLYFCEQNGAGPTVIARYGNEGSDYTSGLHAAHLVPVLTMAKQKAIKQGYLQ